MKWHVAIESLDETIYSNMMFVLLKIASGVACGKNIYAQLASEGEIFFFFFFM